MGISAGVAADWIGSFFAGDGAVAAGADATAGAVAADAGGATALDAGTLTASDASLTAGVDGASAATASTAGGSAADVAAAQGVGGTGEGLTAAANGAGSTALTSGQMLTAAQTAVSGVNLAKTLLTPKPQLNAPAAPAPMPQAPQAPNAQGVNMGVMTGGGLGGTPGVASTLLTGGGGVNPSTLDLGRNTLLGS